MILHQQIWSKLRFKLEMNYVIRFKIDKISRWLAQHSQKLKEVHT